MKGVMDEQFSNQFDALFKKIDDIDDALKGSFEKPGLNERVRRVEDFVSTMKSYHQKIINVIIGSTATIVGSIVVAVVVYILRI